MTSNLEVRTPNLGSFLGHPGVAHGTEAVVKLLLATDGVNPDFKDNNGSQDRYGQTLLLLAAGNGYGAVVKLLLAKPALTHTLRTNSIGRRYSGLQ